MKLYWNSPYDDTDTHDEFGYAKGYGPDAQRQRQYAEAIIQLAEGLCGWSKPVYIRKDYSDEFNSFVGNHFNGEVTCRVETSDPSMSGGDFLVVRFWVSIDLPPRPIYALTSIHDSPAGMVLLSGEPPYSRRFAYELSISYHVMETNEAFTAIRRSLYAEALYYINSEYKKALEEQRRQ